ncbi:hypothetical protein ACG9X6_13455 [Acinetobacter guillouiae]|uniref:hypothetical protein n=1 Tax=Acinetobacter TaxID=469 RepID=UPI001FBBF9C3|nr:hypothetical protein [Acinetobacter sp. NyZ410]UOH20553.1 hypothetical protein MTO68_10510 [Acinetobacter sp. NyZ410]
MMTYSNIIQNLSADLASSFALIQSMLKNYFMDLNILVVNKDEFDYFCMALLFTICSKNLSNDDQQLILSGFKYSEYAKIKVNYYIEYFNLDSSCLVDDLEINSLTNALFDSVNTDFDSSSINHYVVILDFKNMMADILKMYS